MLHARALRSSTLAVLLLLVSHNAHAETQAETPAQPALMTESELEDQIALQFAANKCDPIRAVVPPSSYGSVRPIVLAVVAYCHSPEEAAEAERLFGLAETLAPGSDTIVVLHARYRFKIDPPSAMPLWRKVLLLARTPATKAMAQEYLDGNGEGDEGILLGSSLSYYANFQAGLGFESNPLGSAFERPSTGSNAANLQFGLGFNKVTDYGSYSTNYGLTNNRYFNAHDADFLAHDLNVPVALRVGSRQDLVFKPFGSLLTLGDSAYQVLGGFGVSGVAYENDSRQSVQASVFQDHYYLVDLQQQDGSHVRFDYEWDFFPESTYLRFLAHIEHVLADKEVDPDAGLGINNTHTDIGFDFLYDYNFRKFSIGIAPRVLLREDSTDSTYLPQNSGSIVAKRREDMQLILQPHISVPLAPYVQALIYYEWNRTYSNLGSNDYVDKNILNQTVGVALRAFVANY